MNITPEMMAEDEKQWYARDVITELGYCGNYMCDRKNMTNLDIRFYAYIMRKAHDLLKEQEPRVMTEGDVLNSTGKPMWFESRGMYLGQKGFWCLPFEVNPELHIRFVQSMTGGKITLSLIDYGKVWRAWTSRPTPDQMRDTKWEETDNG